MEGIRKGNDGQRGAHVLNARLDGNRATAGSLQAKDGRRNISHRQAQAGQQRHGRVDAERHVVKDVRKDEHFQRLTNDDDEKACDAADLRACFQLFGLLLFCLFACKNRQK